MKLAAKQAELSACPYVSEEAKAQLDAAAAPPVRLVAVEGTGHKAEAGNETVLYRHEKTFFHQPGLFVRVKDSDGADKIKETVAEAMGYTVDYVGMELFLDGIAVAAESGDSGTFSAAVKAAAEATDRPLILIAATPDLLRAGLEAAGDGRPLLHAATGENWEEVAALAKEAGVAVVVRADTLDELAELTEKVKDAGVEDIVLDSVVRDVSGTLVSLTQIRRLALKSNFRPLGYPIISFPGEGASDPLDEAALASQAIAKYGGFIVLDNFTPASAYALLALRTNIYTNPQEPIKVQPGVYEINDPSQDSPLMVTTNFSITYFSVANEVDGSGLPSWLLVADAEGMSVLTAWAAGKFDAERIAKTVKTAGIEAKISHKKLIIPGHVAVLLGELEEELPGWEILVGPREAVDLPGFLKLWSAS
jgi:acetyl-CoA decarbonylase/synthase complex subunit gamma